MLFMNNNPTYLCNCLGVLTLLLWVCAGYAYRVNTLRSADDPEKRDFNFGAILIAPVTWPLIIFGSITIFLFRGLVYVVFLALSLIALLVIRESSELIWLDRIATKIGNKLLGANTFLIKIAFGRTSDNPQIP